MDELKNRLIELCRFQMILGGVTGVRMDDLAQNVGISKKTLYKLFVSKDELVFECTKRFFNECSTSLNNVIFDHSIPFPDKLRRVTELITQYTARMSPALMNDLRRNHHALWQYVEKQREEQIFSLFRSLIEEGVSNGFFVPHYNIDLIVLMYYNAINYTLNPNSLHNASFTPEEGFQTIFGILLGGILTEPARHFMYPSSQTNHAK